ncbi:c-type cytochrome biogenesis protein CcmI [Nitrincola schmidtii]|uniref:c-type cytochrome biogenesis protein CcmI n=1 Tax=Nitrincola schmidtii TaxID=1730894 RepID=UPI00124F245A|nr:c-type cytochrome biogenesis protein CcmI [Nitrincola schmidtii]
MTLLWVGIGVLTLIAVAFVFWPLIQSRKAQVVETEADRTTQNIEIFRERLEELEKEKNSGTLTEENFQELKVELEKNLLIDAEVNRRQAPVLKVGQSQLITITLIALLVPTTSFGLYAYLGRADDVAARMAMDAWQQAPMSELSVDEAIAQLEDELARRPQNAEGWYLLATTRMNMNQFSAAVSAFEESLKHLPEETPEYPMVMGQLAQAMFFAADGQMTEAVLQQVEATLAKDPDELTALGLVGIAAFEIGEYQTAITYWERALRSADGQSAMSLQTGIERARQALQAQGGEELSAEIPATGPGVRIDLDVDSSIMTEIRGDQFVFIFARAPGERMPITVERIRVADLPTQVFLSGSSSMVEGISLNDFENVDIVARISVSGMAEEQPGDFKAELSNVKVTEDETPVSLIIADRIE